jgi:hypothetical protein
MGKKLFGCDGHGELCETFGFALIGFSCIYIMVFSIAQITP